MKLLLITILLAGELPNPSTRESPSVVSALRTTGNMRMTVDSTQTPLRMPTDTGRMVWGREDFVRYDAQACDRAIQNERFNVRRTRVQDTVFRTLEHETLPPHVQQVARSCGDRFTAENTPDEQLWSALRLVLAGNRDGEIDAVVSRKMAAARSVSEKARTLLLTIETLMYATPERFHLAQRFLQRLDSLGSEAKLYQYNARLPLLAYWESRFVRDSIQAYAEGLLSRFHALEQSQQDEANLLVPYGGLLNASDLERDFLKQDSVIDRAMHDVGNWRLGAESRIVTGLSSLMSIRKRLYNKQTRPLDGGFWFNHGGTPQPSPGKMSLLVHVDHTYGESGVRLYTLIRQLHERYGDALVFTLITETRGYSVGTGPLEPADEAKHAASYFLDFLKLPVVVLVDEAPYRPLPDGRRRYLTSPVGEVFDGWQFFNAVLTDREGKIQWIGSFGSDRDEARVVALIDRLR